MLSRKEYKESTYTWVSSTMYSRLQKLESLWILRPIQRSYKTLWKSGRFADEIDELSSMQRRYKNDLISIFKDIVPFTFEFPVCIIDEN